MVPFAMPQICSSGRPIPNPPRGGRGKKLPPMTLISCARYEFRPFLVPYRVFTSFAAVFILGSILVFLFCCFPLTLQFVSLCR